MIKQQYNIRTIGELFRQKKGGYYCFYAIIKFYEAKKEK